VSTRTPSNSADRATGAVRALVALLVALVLGLPGWAAATSTKDLQVGVRGVDFLADPPRGKVPVAVVYDAASKASQQDAQAISSWLTASARGTKAELVPILLEVQDLDRAPAYRVAIIANGLEASFSRILDFARRNVTLTITADLACVRSGACVLGIATEPAVEVIVSRQASTICGVEFQRAFRMMVKEY
jgi:hypothetical protein